MGEKALHSNATGKKHKIRVIGVLLFGVFWIQVVECCYLLDCKSCIKMFKNGHSGKIEISKI